MTVHIVHSRSLLSHGARDGHSTAQPRELTSAVSGVCDACTGLAVGLQAELNRVRQATAALEHDFKQLSKDFLHGLKKEREQDQGTAYSHSSQRHLLSGLPDHAIGAVR